VVKEFESQDRVVKINAEQEPDQVYRDVQEKLRERGVKPINLTFVQTQAS
jgi:UMP-CMP kinase